MCYKSQVDGICLKLCHRAAGPVWLINDRPICSFSLRRNIGKYFLNGICGVSNTLVCDVYYLLKAAKATTAVGKSSFQRELYLMMYFILFRCFIYLGSFISCSCERFKRTRTIYHPYQRHRSVHSRMSNISDGPWAYDWE